jgi:hypothetical protein
MILVPFHLGWRGPQNRRAGFESRKEPQAAGIASRPGASAGQSSTLARRELPGAWLTMEQNHRLAVQCTIGRVPRPDAGCVSESRVGCRMIEIFVAILPIEWG